MASCRGDPALSPTLASSGTVAGMILGTAGYMSPEQMRGRPVDRRTDVWAFGVVLFELLTGRPLFAGDTITGSDCRCRDHRARLVPPAQGHTGGRAPPVAAVPATRSTAPPAGYRIGATWNSQNSSPVWPNRRRA